VTADAVVRARIDEPTKDRATQVLNKMGLTPSDLIRITFKRVAAEGRVPFSLEIPNSDTRAALDELDNGGGVRFSSVAELMDDLRG
jgi:DNA-damage-inducible protein J